MDPVTLRSPTRQPYTTRDPSEITRLVYGHGYTRETQHEQPATSDLALAADEPAGDEFGVEDDEFE